MVSMALFPCSYTDEARLVGELSNALHARMYTDELLIEDVSKQYTIPTKYLKKRLYGAAAPENWRTLEKEKYINLFKQFLVKKLSRPERHVFFGFLASLIGPEITNVLKILVVDSKAARVKRAIQQEHCNFETAVKIIDRHDHRVSQWTGLLFSSSAYDYSLYDHIVSYNRRDMLTVKEEIIERFNGHDRFVQDNTLVKQAQDMERAAAVERVLLERGYRAGVHIHGEILELKVEVSSHNYPWLAHKLVELSHCVQGVREVRVERSL